MFFKKTSLGRAALLSALVVILSVFVTSCQPVSQTKYVDKIVYRYAVPLESTDPICGDWKGKYTYGGVVNEYLLLKSASDFVWATCCSGDQAAQAGSEVTISTGYSTEYYTKGTPSIYVVYNSKDGVINKKEGVLLFVAKTSTYGTPAVGKWYGVKFQINAADATKALIEGAAGDAYKNIATLAEAVEKFAFDNTECFNPTYWTESASGATKQ